MQKHDKNKAFTLIELAISLAILGLVLGGGLVALNPLIKGVKLKATQSALNNAENALISYVIQRGDLPCPATSMSDPEGTCNSVSVQHGILPWRALGLQKSEARDGWGRMLSYSVDRSYTSGGTISLNCDTNGIPQSDWSTLSSDINLIDEVGTPATSGLFKPAYIIISHGENGLGATMPSGKNVPGKAGASLEEKANLVMGTDANPNSTPATYYSSLPDSSSSVGFDDIIKAKSAGRILVSIGCSGK